MAAAATRLDARGLACPLPVLRAKKAIRDVAGGGLLEIIATDPSTVRDFQAFCKATGHRLESWAEEAGEYTFLIRKKP